MITSYNLENFYNYELGGRTVALRGDYITECLGEINRRIGYIEELENQFSKSMDSGIKNLKSDDETDDALQDIRKN